MIETTTLINFLNGELSKEENNQVRQFLAEHPHYYDVLKGLSNMQKEQLGNDLEIQLRQKKSNLRDGIFL